MTKKKSRFTALVVLFLLVLFSIFFASSVGAVPISITTTWKILLSKLGFYANSSFNQYEVLTIWELRLPRVILSLLTGASLAICGALFQSIFRNPICDPYILGISSGASLGAAIAFILGLNVFFFGVTIAALISGLLTLFVIITIAQFGNKQSTYSLLLIGIAINFFLSAIITLLIVINQESMQKIIFWTMGSFGTTSWSDILLLISIMIPVIFILYYHSKDLNILQLGSETAKTLGVNTEKITILTLSAASVLIATAVSICGVIGFIGLIVPHIVRILVGNNIRTVFIFSLFVGAIFMLIADTLARIIAIPSELPVGSITAMAGAPYFIYLLIRRKKEFI